MSTWERGNGKQQLYSAFLLACAILADGSCPGNDFGRDDKAVKEVLDCPNCEEEHACICWEKVLMRKGVVGLYEYGA